MTPHTRLTVKRWPRYVLQTQKWREMRRFSMDREGMWEMEERSRDLVACRVPHYNTAQEKERRRWERFGDKVSSVLLRRDEDGMHETTTDELADVEMPSGEMPRELGELEHTAP